MRMEQVATMEDFVDQLQQEPLLSLCTHPSLKMLNSILLRPKMDVSLEEIQSLESMALVEEQMLDVLLSGWGKLKMVSMVTMTVI